MGGETHCKARSKHAVKALKLTNLVLGNNTVNIMIDNYTTIKLT